MQFHACRVKLENGSFIPAKFGESTGRGGLYTLGADEKYSGDYSLLCGDNQVRLRIHGRPDATGHPLDQPERRGTSHTSVPS